MSTTTVHAATLSPQTLALAVADCVLRGLCPDTACAALPREDPLRVRAMHEAVLASREDVFVEPLPGRGAKRGKRGGTRRPSGRAHARGLTLSEIEEETGISRSTLKAAMIHQGYLADAYHGRQRRTLVTEAAERAGLGHNVETTGKHSPRISGFARSAPFPVFFADRLDDVLWTLDLGRIAAHCARLADKRRRLEWLVRWHHYLPNDELKRLSGMSQRSVEAAAAKARAAAEDQRRRTAAGSAPPLIRGWALMEMAENGGRLRRPSPSLLARPSDVPQDRSETR
ncbi:hypothetical protein J5Y09_18195 [Roseomonas sp. PWR1]|uniref:Uncharacterized protein n=1 Tax=Roseomonas nitratireducens TaxID=2820810 RepID=A0ABS4AWX1_9PROT|nr:hypothetical protein [Neoroseomonas nitratireducens]MBP0465863.1 hypothetical protein [Neoroseomonas nitratireducens]